MMTRRLVRTAASAVLLLPGVASAQEFSGEVDLLELHSDFDDANVVVDATAELRQDSHGLALKVAGNGDLGPSMDDVEVQALFLQQVGPSTALMGGVRYDFRPGRNFAYASAAVTHDFADWISGEAFAYVSEDGDVTGSSEVVAVFEFGSGLELEPRVEVFWSAQDVAEEGFAAGLSELSASMRLRRELIPDMNVYVGIIHDRLLSDTRKMARAAGDSVQVTKGMVGMGLQF